MAKLLAKSPAHFLSAFRRFEVYGILVSLICVGAKTKPTAARFAYATAAGALFRPAPKQKSERRAPRGRGGCWLGSFSEGAVRFGGGT
jgi:hypothetical protein